MKVLDRNRCFICQIAKPDFVISVQQRWGGWKDYPCHKSCFAEVSGQELKREYSHKEWLELAGGEWLLKNEWVFVDRYGNKFWYLKGKFHREDGPAVEWANGTREWWAEGRLHRWSCH